MKGNTKVNLYKDDEIIMSNQTLANVISYLDNHNLIDLKDKKYWLDDGNDYVCRYVKRYGRIYQEQKDILNSNYKIEKVK